MSILNLYNNNILTDDSLLKMLQFIIKFNNKITKNTFLTYNYYMLYNNQSFTQTEGYIKSVNVLYQRNYKMR